MNDEGQSTAEYGRLLDGLAALAQSVGTAPDVTSVYRALLAFIRAFVPCNALFVSHYDAERRQRNPVHVWVEGKEIDPSTLPALPMTQSPNSRSVETGQIIVTDDLQAVLPKLPHI